MKIRSRFSSFRDKLQVFLLGLLFGLVLGGGFFILKLDQYVKELSFYKSLTQSTETAPGTTTATEDPSTKQKPKKIKRSEPIVMNADSAKAASNDSMLPAVFDGDQAGDEMVIRKDELLAQKQFSILNIPGGGTDSTARSANAPLIMIEFWKSPLNYRGYKFSRNKLVLFGVESADVENLYKDGGNIYIKALNNVYRIETTSDFKQLERVADEELIARMK